MPMPAELLEQQAELLFNNVAGWESRTLERIAKRIKKTGKMNLADIKSIDNMAVTRKEMDDIIKDLAQVTGQNVAEVQKIYSDSIDLQHKNNQYLYDYRNKPFVPLSDNKQLQALVNAYSRTTAETMINLSKTKALGFVDSAGKFTNMQDSIYDALGKATMQVATGSGDFHTAMRGVIEQLGGSGIRVHYGSGVNRRLDTVVRQNLLWGGKQASIEYNDMVGDELGCDGIEIDYHSNPRPSHRFMQGEMFSLHGKKTINGVTYEDAADALERLDDYGCLHFKTPVILGVSEPRYSQEQLNEMRLKDLKMHKVDDVEKTGYEWTQVMRRLETEARKEKEIINGLKAAGDEEGARQHRKKLRAINEKYNKICDETGLTPQKERMRIYGGAKTTDTSTKTIAKSEKSGIINYKLSIRSMNAHADSDIGVFDIDEIEENLSKTNIGKSALEYIDKNNMFVTFNYDPNSQPGICGSVSKKDITIYPNNCEDLQDVCGTVIHETAHIQFDWQHTQEDEVNCYLMELLHKKESISESDIKKIVEFVKREYSYLPEGELYGY